MKTVLALCLVAFLSGCATTAPDASKEVLVNALTPPRPAVAPVIDEQCASLAKTARAIALLRDTGIPQEDVPLMTKPQAFPILPMVREVYARADITPELGAMNSYAVCTGAGYETIVAALMAANTRIIDNEKQIAKDIHAAKKSVMPPPEKQPLQLKMSRSTAKKK